MVFPADVNSEVPADWRVLWSDKLWSGKLAHVVLRVPADACSGGGGGGGVDAVQVVGLRPLAEAHPSPPVHAAVPPVLHSVVAAAMEPSGNFGPPLAHLPD